MTDTSAAGPSRIIEICIETIDEALQAVEAGATRLEVCACMTEAGTTPSRGLIEAVVERAGVPVFVMIRPRGGDFHFNEDELDVMCRDIASARAAGAHGIVSGALEAGGAIDHASTRELVGAAGPLPFTFHRAFDLVPDLPEALAVLRTLGVSRILTSGGASSALVGGDVIAGLMQRAGTSMTIIAGGGVRAGHVAELVRRTGVNEVHARPTRIGSKGQVIRDVRFGGLTPGTPRSELDAAAVRALAIAVAKIS